MSRVSTLLVLLLLNVTAAHAVDSLEKGFLALSDDVRPKVWWHWMNGSVTKEGIRADLEDMKRVGIGGVQLLDIAPGFTRETMFPAGPVRWGSDAWHEHLQYALRTAAELGLSFGLHNCAGWSESGGPWVTPEDSMKKVVWTETPLSGGKSGRVSLPRPTAHFDFYRDIAVLAVPADPETPADRPLVTSSTPLPELERLIDGRTDPDGCATFPKGTENLVLTFAFPGSTERRLLTLRAPYQRGADVRLGGDVQVSDDGVTYRTLRSFGFPGTLFAHKGYIGSDLILTVPFAPATARFYRIAFKGALNPLTLAEVSLTRSYRIENYQSKTLTSPLGSLFPPPGQTVADAAISTDQVIDLSARLASDGSLSWDAPPGRWTLLRIGYTTTGLPNHPSQDEGTGLEVDKMNPAALRRHWDAALGRILREAGPLVGKTLTSVLSDSWEAAQQNWTADFPVEFEARRGYALHTYLPVLTGRVVGSLADSEGFLDDFRRTCSDLITTHYFGEMRRLAEQAGLTYYGESYGGKTYNEYQAGLNVGVNMAEFWFWRDRSKLNVGGLKARASIAHVRGHPLMAAESFTATQTEAGWAANPALLKPAGDLAFSQGLNQIFLHSYVHQPYSHLMPGFTVGSSGSNFNRLNTWWPRAGAWLDYLARCQFLLRQGRFVADVLLVKHPGTGSFQTDRFPVMPSGYDFDEADPSTLTGASIEQGRIRLASGATYRLLVFPAVWQADFAFLHQLESLVTQGASVVGPPPYAHRGRLVAGTEADWKQQVDRIWSSARVSRSGSLAAALAALRCEPDCTFTFTAEAEPVRYLHRSGSEGDLYFLSTTADKPTRFVADFRVGDRAPELWDPVTGAMSPAPAFRQANGRTQIDLTLGDAGSLFVVFRKPTPEVHPVRIADANQNPLWLADAVSTTRGGVYINAATDAVRVTWSDGREQTIGLGSAPVEVPIDTPWSMDAETPLGERSHHTFATLRAWNEEAPPLKSFSGTAIYRTEFVLPELSEAVKSNLLLDLGDVRDLAHVTLNGTSLGTLWTPPFVVDATSALRPGRNSLVVEVRNRWVNRLMADHALPPDVEYQQKLKNAPSWGIIARFPEWMLDRDRVTQRARRTFTTYQTHYKPGDTPPVSGLLGPVKVRGLAPLNLPPR
ncbi:MAG: glycosyl hydrolase [Opitutaceae bacterium]